VAGELAIRTSGLTKDFGGGNGLFGLDLGVRHGEVLGFLGPNGAGKSTTMRLLLDQIRPTAGSASVLGLDSRRDGLEIRRRVGFLPGDLALHPRLTGAAMLDFLAELRGGVDRRVRDALAERFGAQLDRPVHELSTGNRQKIGLIQAFMHEPELLILDEPIAGLDPLVQQSFHALLGEVVAEGRTVFLSSHTLSEVERVADRVAIARARAGATCAADLLRRQAARDAAAAGHPGPELLVALDALGSDHDEALHHARAHHRRARVRLGERSVGIRPEPHEQAGGDQPDGHVALEHPADPAEHLALGQPGLVVQLRPDPIREHLVVGHGAIVFTPMSRATWHGL
jgi:ABC-2 type transport system ATP-binding protein